MLAARGLRSAWPTLALATAVVALCALGVVYAVRTYLAEAEVAAAREHMAWARLEEAHEAVWRGLRWAPDNARIHRELGRVEAAIASFRGEADALDRALEAFQTAANLQPLDADVRAELGRTALAANRLDLALEAMREALRLDPHNAYHLSVLGHVLERQGRLDEAAEAYRRAYALVQDDGIRDRLRRLEER